MPWARWVVLGLVLFNGGWMAFDGLHAVIKGDYVTPKSGAHTGQLGPWARVMDAVGIEPRSDVAKWIFVLYGGLFVLAASCYFAGLVWAPIAVIVMALLGLWYVPFGTLINIIVIALVIAAKRAG